MERKSYVYKITCLVTGEYYFGSSFNAKRDSYWGGGAKIQERIAQYGKENFVKEILGEFDDRTIAHKVENEYIEQFINDDKCLNRKCEHHFGSFSDDVLNKFHTERSGSGNSFYGKRHSDETKLKIHNSLIGHISWNKGKKNCYSDEVRIKMSASHRGKTLSEETKQKIRESLRCRTPWNKGKKLNKETGKYE